MCPKNGSVEPGRPAVSPFGGRPFGAGIWWFWCVPKPGQNLNVIGPNL